MYICRILHPPIVAFSTSNLPSYPLVSRSLHTNCDTPLNSLINPITSPKRRTVLGLWNIVQHLAFDVLQPTSPNLVHYSGSAPTPPSPFPFAPSAKASYLGSLRLSIFLFLILGIAILLSRDSETLALFCQPL